jgi:hypothetical protein
MNPIERCWRRLKQALHRRLHQPTTEAEMRQAVLEEWDAIPQQWINELVSKQEHWVTVLLQRHCWSTIIKCYFIAYFNDFMGGKCPVEHRLMQPGSLRACLKAAIGPTFFKSSLSLWMAM